MGFDYQVDATRLVGVAVGGSEAHFSVPDRTTTGDVVGGHMGAYGVTTWGARRSQEPAPLPEGLTRRLGPARNTVRVWITRAVPVCGRRRVPRLHPKLCPQTLAHFLLT
jgi:hypothetical protein